LKSNKKLRFKYKKSRRLPGLALFIFAAFALLGCLGTFLLGSAFAPLLLLLWALALLVIYHAVTSFQVAAFHKLIRSDKKWQISYDVIRLALCQSCNTRLRQGFGEARKEEK